MRISGLSLSFALLYDFTSRVSRPPPLPSFFSPSPPDRREACGTWNFVPFPSPLPLFFFSREIRDRGGARTFFPPSLPVQRPFCLFPPPSLPAAVTSGILTPFFPSPRSLFTKSLPPPFPGGRERVFFFLTSLQNHNRLLLLFFSRRKRAKRPAECPFFSFFPSGRPPPFFFFPRMARNEGRLFPFLFPRRLRIPPFPPPLIPFGAEHSKAFLFCMPATSHQNPLFPFSLFPRGTAKGPRGTLFFLSFFPSVWNRCSRPDRFFFFFSPRAGAAVVGPVEVFSFFFFFPGRAGKVAHFSFFRPPELKPLFRGTRGQPSTTPFSLFSPRRGRGRPHPFFSITNGG